MSGTLAAPDTCARDELMSELCPVTPEHGRGSPEKLGGNRKKARTQYRGSETGH